MTTGGIFEVKKGIDLDFIADKLYEFFLKEHEKGSIPSQEEIVDKAQKMLPDYDSDVHVKAVVWLQIKRMAELTEKGHRSYLYDIYMNNLPTYIRSVVEATQSDFGQEPKL